MRKLLILLSVMLVGALGCYAQLPHRFAATYKSMGTYSADGKCIDSKNGIESIQINVGTADKSYSVLGVTMDFGYSMTETLVLYYKGMADNSYVYSDGEGMTVIVTSSKKMVAIMPAELKGKSWRFYNANP